MNYPLLSDYIEAIKSAEDNFDKLKHLRPVLDDDGHPMMSSGNFAVVFKMKDEQTGKLHAVKCFLKEQEGRAEAYRLITEELSKFKKNTNTYRIIKRWPLKEFNEIYRPIKRKSIYSKDNSTGETISYQFLYVPNNIGGEIIIEFSRELGILSNEEIVAKWNELQVVLFKDGKFELSSLEALYSYDERSYLIPIKYLDKELYVDTNTLEETEFPILLMDWVEGCPLDKYIHKHIDNQYKLSMLASEFYRLTMWLMELPLAHGDIKPDNILVHEDGTIVLVDYDGMYVPAMKGQKARELGSPDFKHPSRTENDFDKHIDDFSLASILLSIKAISIDPKLLETYGAIDRLLFSEKDYRDSCHSDVLNLLYFYKDPKLEGMVRLFQYCLNNKDFHDVPLWFIDNNFFLNDYLQNYPSQIVLDSNSPHFKWYNKGLYTSDYKNLVYYPYIKEPHEILLHPNTEVLSFGFEDVSEAADPDSSYEWQWDYYPTTILYQCTPNIKFELPVNALLCVPKGTVDLFVNFGYEKTKIIEGLVYIDSFGVVYSHDKKELLKFPFYSDLEYYRIIDTCETIRDDAFSRYATCVGYEGEYYAGNCLKCIVLPDSLKTIGKLAFCRCEFLESISIPSNVEYIEEDAFLGCTGLNSIIVDKRNCKYDSRNNCNAIIESTSNTLVIGCKNTRIPGTITTIGKGAFYDCCQLKRIMIPESIIAIKEDAFCGCFNLSSVIIPDSTVSIGGGAFYKCEGLTKIRLGNNVTNIGDNAFGECVSLESIKIPKNIHKIGTNILEKCSALTAIEVDEENKTYDSRESCNAIIETKTNTLVLGCSSTVIPNSVVNIGVSSFSECYGLKMLLIPDGVEVIGDHAFEWCIRLESISLPHSILKIGDGILNNCFNLKTIHIPAGKILNYKKLLPVYYHHLFVEDFYEELPF